MESQVFLQLILRIGIFGTFLGHGIFALAVKPEWIPFLTTVGFSVKSASLIMILIGALDILVAITVLVLPLRIILIWAAIWAFSAALIRPISGTHFLDFVERSANWTLPLVLLFLQGLPRNFKDLFSIYAKSNK
ncbi:MAG: hypothetical protein COA32_08090 [Fluviicola sp.]|nr:MAG: hypothetical protein COA32_08090 [Fluviicola sp.]